MAFKYKVHDDNGDVSIIRFDFDLDKGRLVMKSEPRRLVAIGEYTLPREEYIVESFELFRESGGEADQEEDKDGVRRTLLVMLTDEWCDTPIKVHEAEAIFDTSLKMLFITTAAKVLSKRYSENGEEMPNVPHVRIENASFLWDTFVYVHEQAMALQADPEKRREVIDQIREETGHEDFELADVLPKKIGCWALPVRMYGDQDYIVTRVPYEVMEDLYDEWKKHRDGTSFDGSAIGDGELPTDITEEINALFKKFGKKRD